MSEFVAPVNVGVECLMRVDRVDGRVEFFDDEGPITEAEYVERGGQ